MKALLLVLVAVLGVATVRAQCPALQFTQSVELISGTDSQYRILFQPTTPGAQLEWVDVHFSIDGNALMNNRMMFANGQGNQGGGLLEFRGRENPIILHPGQTLQYFFTYCVMGPQGPVDCDTERFNFSPMAPAPPPAAIQAAPTAPSIPRPDCPVIQYSANLQPMGNNGNIFKLTFMSTSGNDLPVAWVDAHYRINSGELINERMIRAAGANANSFEWLGRTGGLVLQAGDTMTYFFTYCVATPGGPVDCNTPLQTYTSPVPQPPQNIEQPPQQPQQPIEQPQYQPQPQPQPQQQPVYQQQYYQQPIQQQTFYQQPIQQAVVTQEIAAQPAAPAVVGYLPVGGGGKKGPPPPPAPLPGPFFGGPKGGYGGGFYGGYGGYGKGGFGGYGVAAVPVAPAAAVVPTVATQPLIVQPVPLYGGYGKGGFGGGYGGHH